MAIVELVNIVHGTISMSVALVIPDTIPQMIALLENVKVTAFCEYYIWKWCVIKLNLTCAKCNWMFYWLVTICISSAYEQTCYEHNQCGPGKFCTGDGCQDDCPPGDCLGKFIWLINTILWGAYRIMYSTTILYQY